jgi:anti-sigma regulatory factor (Ser/Thr protein kinase)
LEGAGARNGEVFEVLLATSEAFTNAVEHPQERTSRRVDVTASLRDECLRISIHDYGTWQSDERDEKQGGLGLVLMDALMDTVQIECIVGGTTVTMSRRLASARPQTR